MSANTNMNIFAVLDAEVSTPCAMSTPRASDASDNETWEVETPIDATYAAEFPSLGATIPALGDEPAPKKKTKGVKRAERRQARRGTDVTAEFITFQRYQRPTRTFQRHQQGDSARSAAFERLQNKDEHAKTLTCTRACQYVVPKEDKEDKDGKLKGFGVCYREQCTFAHSLEEFGIAQCAFDDACSHNHCTFKHSCETVEEFYERTGKVAPQLPPTSEKSRQPRKRRDPNVPRKTAAERANIRKNRLKGDGDKVLGSACGYSKSAFGPKLTIDLSGEPISVEKAPKDLSETKAPPLKRSDDLGVDRITDTHIIRVPKGMAEMALEMAISQGLQSFEIIEV